MMNETSTNTIDSSDITAALNSILTTDKFSASPQMSAFLKYVVEQTLMGNTRRIKAFTVGIEALGKSPNFDPQTDPSVRVLAKRLRSSLDTYYSQNPDTPIFIEMKPGSYIPRFLLRSEMPVAQPENSGYVQINPDNAPATGTEAPAPVSVQQNRDSTTEQEGAAAAGISQLWQPQRSSSKVA